MKQKKRYDESRKKYRDLYYDKTIGTISFTSAVSRLKMIITAHIVHVLIRLLLFCE